MLLRALAEEYSQDHIDVVCPHAAIPGILSSLPNLQVHPLLSRLPLEAKRLIFESQQVGALARRLRADVIWSLNVGPYVRTGIPQVLSLNNAFQVYPWRDCANFHPKSRAVLAGLRWFFRHSLRRSDAAIAQTPLMRQYLQRIPGSPRRIAVIPKSVEGLLDADMRPLPAAMKSALRPDCFRFLYVATSAVHKNHATAIRACELLAQRQPNVQLVLTLEPEQALAIGGSLAQRLLASGHLSCVGWVEKSYLRSLYESCDACIMPSMLESLSSSYLEAMGWSRPQIVSDLPFARDTCGNAALYAESTSPSDWSGQMEELAGNRGVRDQLIAKGLAQLGSFPSSWRDMAHQVRSFLYGMVGQWKSA